MDIHALSLVTPEVSIRSFFKLELPKARVFTDFLVEQSGTIMVPAGGPMPTGRFPADFYSRPSPEDDIWAEAAERGSTNPMIRWSFPDMEVGTMQPRVDSESFPITCHLATEGPLIGTSMGWSYTLSWDNLQPVGRWYSE